MKDHAREDYLKLLADYEGLAAAVRQYLSECDNPVPDALYRHTLRDRLRQLTERA